uniref:TBC1 domain family member 23 n=1 Tax=Timema bartmani TaxID=61472 RepID=A0A7R9F3H0_9NEOP|nr:unnamed protein product [Timema bartmani]
MSRLNCFSYQRILDLETALLDDCSADILYGISKGKNIPECLRAEVWQVCLDVQDKGNQLVLFNEIFDLPEQNLLRDDCQKVVANLGNEDEDKVSVVSDLESILTFYCKSSGVQYEQGNGWIEILLPLISLKLPRSDTYNLFEAIKHRYIPRGCKKNGVVFHVFRLLLLYHDPELCSFLDTMRISPDLYCLSWFQSLFAATCGLPVGLCMWDLYFQKADPFFVFFLALVMIVNAREQILSMKNDSKQTIVDTLSAMPCALEADDVTDFCSLAQYYDLKTPSSFKETLVDTLFNTMMTEEDTRAASISQALCLPVTAHELVSNAAADQDPATECVRFFLVDCRPADQYNAGHLPTAFHLDCNLMLQEPAAFLTAVQGLLSAQRQALAARSAAGGEHLCFLGSGRVEEDQYTHMVVASFLQKHTHYVGMVSGGYKGEYRDLLSTVLQGAAMKLKSAEVKGKLFDYIVNPTGSSNTERHVSSSDKLGKRYLLSNHRLNVCRPVDSASVASPEEDEHQEVVSISTWLNKPEVVKSFKCHEVKVNGYMYDSHLLVTDSHVYVLRDLPGKRGFAHIVVRRPLSAIVKITSKKKHPELITFKYGVPEGEELIISDMDRFLIPEASKATGIISQQILKHLKSKEG